jgi:hypothetical protein
VQIPHVPLWSAATCRSFLSPVALAGKPAPHAPVETPEIQSGDKSPHSISWPRRAVPAPLLLLAMLVAGCGPGSGGQNKETEVLLEHLRSGGTQYRAHAARRLGELKDEAAIGPLT